MCWNRGPVCEYALESVTLLIGRNFPSCGSSSLFHRARTVQVAVQELQNSRGCLAYRQRALRLVKRVAKLVDSQAELPTKEQIIEFCTQCTTKPCKLRAEFRGGFLWQYWLVILGPKWAVDIISERLQVASLTTN